MADNYKFLDAYGSVLTAAAKDVSGAYQPFVQIQGSVTTVGTAAANQSVSGTVNLGATSIAALQGTNPWQMVGSVAVMSAVPHSVATLQGTNPWIVVGSVAVMSAIPHSVATLQGTNPWIVSGAVSVVGGPLNINSILGTFAEDAGHVDGNAGFFQLGVRNDTTSSFVSANKDYTPFAVDSAGRTLIKPFASDASSVFGSGSVNGAASVILMGAPGTGLRNYLTDFTVSNTGTATTLIRITAGGASVLGFTIAPAGGGSNIVGLATPMAAPPNSPINFAADTASSVVYGTAYGYIAP